MCKDFFSATGNTYCEYHPDFHPKRHVAIFQGNYVLRVRE